MSTCIGMVRGWEWIWEWTLICLKEIGLRDQTSLIILGSIVDMIGVICMIHLIRSTILIVMMNKMNTKNYKENAQGDDMDLLIILH